MRSLFEPKECAECGDAAVVHPAVYATTVIDAFLYTLFPPREGGALKAFEQLVQDSVGPYLLRALVAVGIARKVTAPDDDTFSLGKAMWEEAMRRGIIVWEWRLFGLPRNIFIARLPNGRWLSYEGVPDAPSAYKRKSWMDDKAHLKKEFLQRGFPVARGGAAKTEHQALALFHSLRKPVITKPHNGSRSRHTTLHLSTEEDLLRGYRIAKLLSPQVIVEEELQGFVHRATVVDGKFAAAFRREQAHVVGDGVHTVRELVDEENKNPVRNGPLYAHLMLDDNAIAELSWQGLLPDSIPEKGAWVNLNQKVSWGLGGTTVDETDVIHPDNRTLFEEVAAALCAPIVGIDFICTDLSRSWKEQDRAGILECNSMPFLEDHLHPFSGKSRNVPGNVWDMIYSPSQTLRPTR